MSLRRREISVGARLTLLVCLFSCRPGGARQSGPLPPIPEGLAWGQAISVPHAHSGRCEWHEGGDFRGPLGGVTFRWFALGYCDHGLVAARGAARQSPHDPSADAFVESMNTHFGAAAVDDSDWFFSTDDPQRAYHWAAEGGGLSIVAAPAIDGDRQDIVVAEVWWSPQGDLATLPNGRLSTCDPPWHRFDPNGLPIVAPLPECR